MKRYLPILVFSLFAFSAGAQLSFRTEAPQNPIVVGESFQVEYILEDAGKTTDFIPPVFKNFRLVTGPHNYSVSVTASDGVKQRTNAVYTLVPIKTGRYIIEGASAMINGKQVNSNDVVVEVISKEEAIRRQAKLMSESNSAYFLQPGEDVYKKISKNLFVKVMVDKNSCFVGEPVVATFKLYSRLQSSSDIVKNPGFYGFTVYDMISLSDQEMVSETINGNTFRVHTLRKVQLYPLRPGHFNIDPMEIENKVEFSKSSVNKKTEQQVVEGVLNDKNDHTSDPSTEIFATSFSTDPVPVVVKSLPEINQPSSFTGAVGKFSLAVSLDKGKLARNEEGMLVVSVQGNGNFTQLGAPTVQWPAGIEGFEPQVKDSLDKTHSPLSGTRTFRYGFVSSRPGEYAIPAVSFSFFNPDTGHYKTINEPVPSLNVSNEEKKPVAIISNEQPLKKNNDRIYYWFGLAGILAAGLLFFMTRKRPVREKIYPERPGMRISIDEILSPVITLIPAADKDFYTTLRNAVWIYLAQEFKLQGSEMSKEILSGRLEEKKIDASLAARLMELLRQCEAGMFTSATLLHDKKAQALEARQILESIQGSLL